MDVLAPLHLGQGAVESLSMKEAIHAVGSVLVAAVEGRVDQPARQVLDDGRLLVMSATDRTTRDAIVKVLSVRTGDQLPADEDAIVGTLLWVDGRDGRPRLSADGSAVTALRTGAVSGLATDLMAAPDAHSLAMLGAGRQAWTQILAVQAVRGIETLTIANRTRDRAETLATRVRAELPHLEVRVCATASEAIKDADIISCATATATPLFETAQVKRRAHINAVGSYRPTMAELPTDLLTSADVVVVDDLAGCRAESGEIAAALAAGLATSALIPLGSLVAASARETTGTGRTVFKSVGCAALDLALGALLAELADAASAGHQDQPQHAHKNGALP